MRQALEMALEAVKTAQNNLAPSRASAARHDEDALWDEYDATITAIKEALSQPVSSHGNAEDLYIEMNKHLNCPHCGGSGHVDDVAQPEQEPVAYGMWDTQLGRGNRMMMVRLDKGQDGCTVPLYTTPPQRKPLTDEQKMVLCKQFPNHLTFNAIHAIEAAHGIK